MILVTATTENTTDAQRDLGEARLAEYRACGWKPRNSRAQLDTTTGNIVLTFDHRSSVVVEIEVDGDGRWRLYTRGYGWTAWSDPAAQTCRDCGETFAYDADADRCPSCVDWLDAPTVASPRDYFAEIGPSCTCQLISRNVFECPQHGADLRAKSEGTVA